MQNLFFNILTFDWPRDPIDFYFSDIENIFSRKLHFSLYPEKIDKIFPDIVRNSTKNLFTTFAWEVDDFKKLSIDFRRDNPDLVKRFYNDRIKYYFSKIKPQILKIGFIRENQVWIRASQKVNPLFDVYDKFSIKVQLCKVSNYPEIVLSYDGQSRISKQSVAQLIPTITPTLFSLVLFNNRIDTWDRVHTFDDSDPDVCFPVMNKQIESAFGIEIEIPPRDNRYSKYLAQITKFYADFLDNERFRRLIPLHKTGFLNVNPSSVYRVSEESNKLLFGNNTPDIVPKYALGKHKPFKKSPHSKIHLFYIFHKDDLKHVHSINNQMVQGLDFFKGMQSYVGLSFHTESNFSIIFQNSDNPIPEIEHTLSKRQFNPDVVYIAIYITPHGKFEKDKQKREIYYRVKEILLKRQITSQVINPDKMVEQGNNWKFSLPNIAVAMLAKLDGIPWRLNTPLKNELIVGVGAFKNVEQGVQYIGSAFSFNNNGCFNRFEYFQKDEINILAGSIADAVRQYSTINNKPDRLIIHFYKVMSDYEIEPIQEALYKINLNIPIFIVTINKTESEDIVAFDRDWKGLMPLSGTFIKIGPNRFLLFNNTRYEGSTHSIADGYPFPIKLKIQCTNPELTKDTRTITELIDQVYQFSRMYWKSIRQQNLPVTIKYPEIIAEIAPHFLGNDIPAYGKDNLWFL